MTHADRIEREWYNSPPLSKFPPKAERQIAHLVALCRKAVEDPGGNPT